MSNTILSPRLSGDSMKTPVITAVMMSLLILGCDDRTSNEQEQTVVVAETVPPAVPKEIKADSLQVSYAENTVILGAIGGQPFASFGGSGEVTKLFALGPVKVWVFKEIDPQLVDFMKEEYGVEVGGSYLETGPEQFEFIRHVDITLSDEELARQFGIE